MTSATPKRVRCAIYTRVSDDQGLEQDFNSLYAQYDASQCYIRSQAHADWTLIPSKYADGGFTGGDIDRPAGPKYQLCRQQRSQQRCAQAAMDTLAPKQSARRSAARQRRGWCRRGV